MILHFRPTSIIAISIFELVWAGYAYDHDQQGRTSNVTKFQSKQPLPTAIED